MGSNPTSSAALPEGANDSRDEEVLGSGQAEAGNQGGSIDTSGGVQVALTAFVIGFPLLIAGCFFATLYSRPWVFYSPREYTGVDATAWIAAFQGKPNKLVTKTEDLSDQVTTFGRPDRFQLLFKAKGLTWKKSTKAMEVPGGCVVQVSSEQMNPDGSWTIAEALTYVPGIRVLDDQMGSGRYLGPIATATDSA